MGLIFERFTVALFKFFDTAAAVTVGDLLAQIVIDNVPITVEKTELKHAKKVGSSMKKMSQQIEWFKLQHKFNFYQKVKLGNTLRWRLTDAGYAEHYARELTEWVLMRFS